MTKDRGGKPPDSPASGAAPVAPPPAGTAHVGPPTSTAALRELRQTLDKIDEDLVGLIARRMETVARVIREKKGQAGGIRDPRREHEILTRVEALARAGRACPRPLARRIFSEILANSVGPPGQHSDRPGARCAGAADGLRRHALHLQPPGQREVRRGDRPAGRVPRPPFDQGSGGRAGGGGGRPGAAEHREHRRRQPEPGLRRAAGEGPAHRRRGDHQGGPVPVRGGRGAAAGGGAGAVAPAGARPVLAVHRGAAPRPAGAGGRHRRGAAAGGRAPGPHPDGHRFARGRRGPRPDGRCAGGSATTRRSCTATWCWPAAPPSSTRASPARPA